jgi:hypothetical protein
MSIDKEASAGSTAAFSASVGNATKNFMNGSTAKNLRSVNLPRSVFKSKHSNFETDIQADMLRHPARPPISKMLDNYRKSTG